MEHLSVSSCTRVTITTFKKCSNFLAHSVFRPTLHYVPLKQHT